MTRTARPAVLALLAALLAPAAAGCGGEEEARDTAVEDLVLPSPEDREADDALRAARTFLDAGKPRQAEPLLRRVCELAPKNARAHFLLGQALAERGEAKEAVPFLRRAVELEPQNAAAHGLLAASLRAIGDLDAAEKACLAWTEAVRDDEEAWFQLGTVRHQLGRHPDAAQALKIASSKRGARADVKSQLGLVFLAMGQLDDAEARQRDATERRPDYFDAWVRLGDVISQRDPARVREAAAAYERAIECEPRRLLAHFALFGLCRTQGAKEPELVARGETAWQQVLRLHGARQLEERAAAADGDASKTSEFALREEVALHPEDPSPRVALARHLHREGRLDEAVDAYRRALERGAEGSQVRARLGAALLASGDPAGAETVLREAVALAPTEALPHRLLAWALLLRGQDDAAVTGCDAVLAAAPDDALAKRIRALARIHRGELDEGSRDLAAAGGLE